MPLEKELEKPTSKYGLWMALAAIVLCWAGWQLPAQSTRMQGKAPATKPADSLATLIQKANQGNAAAQVNLGLLYDEGHGVPQSYEDAYFWLDLGASHFDPTATTGDVTQKDLDSFRDDAAAHLSPTQLERVQGRAQAWLAAHPALLE